MIGKFFWGILTLPFRIVWLVLKYTFISVVAILLLFIGIDILTDGI